jgi:hypothetical protein
MLFGDEEQDQVLEVREVDLDNEEPAQQSLYLQEISIAS